MRAAAHDDRVSARYLQPTVANLSRNSCTLYETLVSCPRTASTSGTHVDACNSLYSFYPPSGDLLREPVEDEDRPWTPNAYAFTSDRMRNAYGHRKDFQDRLRSQGISLPWAVVSHAETPEVSAHYKRLAAEAKVAHELQYPDYTFCPKKSGQRNAEKAARRAEMAARKAGKKAGTEKRKTAAKAAKTMSRAAGRPLNLPSRSRRRKRRCLPQAASWQAQGWVDPAVEDFWRGAGYEAPAVRFVGGLSLPPTSQIPACVDEESDTSFLADLYDGSAPFPAPFPSTPDFPPSPPAWLSHAVQTSPTPALTPWQTQGWESWVDPAVEESRTERWVDCEATGPSAILTQSGQPSPSAEPYAYPVDTYLAYSCLHYGNWTTERRLR
ncbi:hypothetical protein C8Q78DRAFT_1142856 [Trametes maxima]|nr:hypothetical protein C8Q78DRAFT_1142856 [Trametes maxima]